MFSVGRGQQKGKEQQSVVGSPDDECPVGSMPETAYQKNDECVAYAFPPSFAAAAQWYVQIVAEPGSKRDVPPAPEFGYIACNVRHVEVFHQIDAEQPRCSDGYVRVTGKVAVDLEGEEYGAQKQLPASHVLIVVEDGIGQPAAVIGHNHFLEQSPQYLLHSVYGFSVIKGTWFQKLRQQVGSPLNGSGHQLRKETDEGKEGNDVVSGP